MPATPTEIKDFLSTFKQAARLDLNVIQREKNLEFLTRHGFTPKERKEVLLGLQVSDYCKGPEEDDKVGGPKDIWFFGVDYEGLQIYIKLQLVEEKDEETDDTMRHAKCISFHEAEHAMTFPYEGR
jgi:hypothetical protein